MISALRNLLLLSVLAPLVLFAAQSDAADLPPRSAPPDYYSPAPVSSWQGFYLGVNAGVGFSAFTNDNYTFVGNPTGGLIGGTAGYNFQAAPNLILGVEGDFDFASMKTSQNPYFGVSTSGRVNDLLTVRARVGYTFDRAMVYLTGGFAASDNTVALGSLWTNFYGQQSTYQTGWALGAGIEYMLTSNLSAKAEYLFTSVGSDRYFNFTPNALESGVNNNLFRVGFNYHF